MKRGNWTRLENNAKCDIQYRNVDDDDGHLKLWKLSIELDMPAEDVFKKLLKNRSHWDENLIDSRVVETLNDQTDVIQYVLYFMAPQPSRDFCELRYIITTASVTFFLQTNHSIK